MIINVSCKFVFSVSMESNNLLAAIDIKKIIFYFI
jgi:hypothetical protein